MFLQLNHHKLDAYHFSRLFVLECYKVIRIFPPDERFILIAQIRRAAFVSSFGIFLKEPQENQTLREEDFMKLQEVQ
jgi:hypothetical protein